MIIIIVIIVIVSIVIIVIITIIVFIVITIIIVVIIISSWHLIFGEDGEEYLHCLHHFVRFIVFLSVSQNNILIYVVICVTIVTSMRQNPSVS